MATVRTRLNPSRFHGVVQAGHRVPRGSFGGGFAICMNRAESTGSDEMMPTTSLMVVESRTRAIWSWRTPGKRRQIQLGLRLAASCCTN